MELLTTTRNLAEQLESSDTKSVQKITRNESKEKIAKLQESINGLTSKLEKLQKEKDAYKLLSLQNTGEQTPTEELRSQLQKKEEQLTKLERMSSLDSHLAEEKAKVLNQSIIKLKKEKYDLNNAIIKETSQRAIAEKKSKMLEDSLELLHKKYDLAVKKYEHYETLLNDHNAENIKHSRENETTQAKISILQKEIESYKQNLLQYSKDNENTLSKLAAATQEKETLGSRLSTVKNELEQKINLMQERETYYKEHDSISERLLKKSKIQLEDKIKEVKDFEAKKNSQINWYQKRLDSLTTTNDKLQVELNKELTKINIQRLKISDLEKTLSQNTNGSSSLPRVDQDLSLIHI